MEKLLRPVFKLFCLIDCLFEINEISQIYLSYETITKIRYETEAIISLPAITVCSDKRYLIRDEYIHERDPKNSHEISPQQLIYIGND